MQFKIVLRQNSAGLAQINSEMSDLNLESIREIYSFDYEEEQLDSNCITNTDRCCTVTRAEDDLAQNSLTTALSLRNTSSRKVFLFHVVLEKEITHHKKAGNR